MAVLRFIFSSFFPFTPTREITEDQGQSAWKGGCGKDHPVCDLGNQLPLIKSVVTEIVHMEDQQDNAYKPDEVYDLQCQLIFAGVHFFANAYGDKIIEVKWLYIPILVAFTLFGLSFLVKDQLFAALVRVSDTLFIGFHPD